MKVLKFPKIIEKFSSSERERQIRIEVQLDPLNVTVKLKLVSCLLALCGSLKTFSFVFLYSVLLVNFFYICIYSIDACIIKKALQVSQQFSLTHIIHYCCIVLLHSLNGLLQSALHIFKNQQKTEKYYTIVVVLNENELKRFLIMKYSKEIEKETAKNEMYVSRQGC